MIKPCSSAIDRGLAPPDEAAQVLTRINGLDTLRICLAVWVVFSHGMPPPLFRGYDKSYSYLGTLDALFSWSFNGQAAVIVFFIISGLCIHFPYRYRDTVSFTSFYANRGLRIGIPLVAALLIAWLMGYKQWGDAEAVPIWSLYAELTYYLLYPFIFQLRRKFGLAALIGIAYIISFIGMFYWGPTATYHESGGAFYWKSTLVGLPVWLLGVALAERVDAVTKSPTKVSIWWWRFFALLLSAPLVPIAYWGYAGCRPLLNGFAIYGFFWLSAEIQYFRANDPNRYVEWLGRSSYSVYLLHPSILFAVGFLPFAGHLMSWLLSLFLVLVGSLLFYFSVELPSHRCARSVKRIMDRWSTRTEFARQTEADKAIGASASTLLGR